jgi:non-canonical (house-cleaning) NTP pyrophosphatase
MSGTIGAGVGSEKPFKVAMAKEFLQNEFSSEKIDMEVLRADSGVSEMPRTIGEAVEGASNRSRNAVSGDNNRHFGVGLEGGVFFQDDGSMGLIEAAAISIKLSDTGIYTESGVSDFVKMPEGFADRVRNGELLGNVVQDYFRKRGRGISIEEIQENGSAYYFTNPSVTRHEMMTQALKSALGKLEEGLSEDTPV